MAARPFRFGALGAFVMCAALLSACASGPSGGATPAAAESAAPAPMITELKPADAIRPGQQFLVRKTLRGVALQPFVSQDRAYESVRKQAAKAGSNEIVITWAGKREEDNGGIGGVYFVVEAVAVQWTAFTADIAMGILGSLEERHPLEVESMLANIKASRDPVYGTYLLAALKMSPATKYLPGLVEAYAAIGGASGIPELTKLLRYHGSEAVRIEAGRQLVLLGQRSEVDSAAAVDRSPRVQSALRQALLR
ncbi:hypothetical protein [Hydrocarboniphaga effusa]|uniref:hypothetical protein n=1 Tax=Hydrocarboniphaga effusa TaxID=243629 RepID=UPI003BAB7EDF